MSAALEWIKSAHAWTVGKIAEYPTVTLWSGIALIVAAAIVF